MSGSSRRVIYWDTCCFLTFMSQEQRHDPADLAGVNEQANLCDKGKLDIVTSVVTIIEILESRQSPETQARFEKLWQKPNCRKYQVNLRIASIASELRDYYRPENRKDGLPNLSFPDAIHLATAIWCKPNAFYTFDGNNWDKNRSPKRGLVPLSGNVAGKYSLCIEKPRPIQYSLPQTLGTVP